MADYSIKYLIIGAGPTGLGAAHALVSAGERDFLVLEGAEKAGGLASSEIDKAGFTWDIGGHVHFSHYPEYDAILQKVFAEEEWNLLVRDATVWMQNRLVPYPLQNNMHHLPLIKGLESLAGYLLAPRKKEYENFDHWMRGSFGRPLTELFMRPYNSKVWAHHPREMGYSWIGERVSVPPASLLIKNFFIRAKDKAWGPNKTFRFPKFGGTGAIWSALAKTIGKEHIVFNTRIVGIDWEKREARSESGDLYRYEHMLSTMPLPLLSRMLAPTLDRLTDAAEMLVHSSTHIVGLGLYGKAPEKIGKKSWVYFPEETSPFYRATVFSNYSDSHTPDPARYWSLMTETSSSRRNPREVGTLVEETIQSCMKIGLIDSREQVASVWNYTATHGYPVPSLARDQALSVLLPALEEKGIFSRGRFGGWKYEVSNQDHSFMQGVEWARRMKEGAPEETLFYPERVNTGTPRS
jgi:protoporphyrinogen oxidase